MSSNTFMLFLIFLVGIGTNLAAFLPPKVNSNFTNGNSNVPEESFKHLASQLDNETVALLDELFDLGKKILAIQDRFFELMDEDKDGYLTVPEAKKFTLDKVLPYVEEKYNLPPKDREQLEEKVRELLKKGVLEKGFEKADLDGDGKISKEENLKVRFPNMDALSGEMKLI